MPNRKNILLQDIQSGVDIENDYGGIYKNVMEAEWLILMRDVLEGKIKDKTAIKQIREGFKNEFPPSAIDSLRKDIASAAS